MKKRCLKRVVLLITVIFFLCSFPVFAEGASEESRVNITVPEELRDYLPDDVENFWAVDVMERFDFGFFSKTGMKILMEAAPEAAKLFAMLLGVLLLCAVLGVVKRTVTVPGLQVAMDLVSMVCIASAVFAVTEGVFSLAEEFIFSISSFMSSITPTMAGFMIARGEVTSAAVISGVIFTAVSLLERIVAEILFPLIRLSLCMSLVTNLFGLPGISGIAPSVKKMISYVFGFVTASLSAVLMFQRIIAKSTDSLAMRGIKFAVGQFVPFVGGAVNEALSTVIGGIGTIKAATGITGAVTVCLIAAVPVIRMLLHKTFVEWISVFAGILGLSGEGKLMSEIASYLGYVAAIMAISAVFFILSLSMMASV
ncbi:MAG: hypothetical protein E7603_02595 [Ruminococcaceae bacterium]|nr:hypothetical protein [Oscillospiraceae bacterium]